MQTSNQANTVAPIKAPTPPANPALNPIQHAVLNHSGNPMVPPTLYSQSSSQQAYFSQQVQTASKEQLLLMLFDGAIRFLNMAKAGLEEKDNEKVHNNLVKTQRIITELIATLDVKIGGEASQNLLKLYEYYHHRLVQANMKKQLEPIEEVLGHLRDLRKTWAKAIQIAQKEHAQTSSEHT